MQNIEAVMAAAWEAANTDPRAHGPAKAEEARQRLRVALATWDPHRVYDRSSPKRTSGVAIPAAQAGTHT